MRERRVFLAAVRLERFGRFGEHAADMIGRQQDCLFAAGQAQHHRAIAVSTTQPLEQRHRGSLDAGRLQNADDPRPADHDSLRQQRAANNRQHRGRFDRGQPHQVVTRSICHSPMNS